MIYKGSDPIIGVFKGTSEIISINKGTKNYFSSPSTPSGFERFLLDGGFKLITSDGKEFWVRINKEV